MRRIADALSLPLLRSRVRVDGTSEQAARNARYAALEAMARRHGARRILLAQTADDRAESVLFHLQRGTGLRGLAPMRRRSLVHGVWRVRPALHQRRAALHTMAAPFDPVCDPTNRATGPSRSRLRHLTLPDWEGRLGTDPVPMLCELAQLADRTRGALERASAPSFDRRVLLAQPDALFPYCVEAMRVGPPLSRAAYASLRAYLEAGRGDRDFVTPAGDRWRNGPQGQLSVTV